jgi:hypothetical protein
MKVKKKKNEKIKENEGKKKEKFFNCKRKIKKLN